VEQFTAYFVAHTSLHTNKRLYGAIDELKEQDETHFERLVKEVSGEVMAVWREKRAARKDMYFQQSDMMEMRTEIARRLETRIAPPQKVDLAASADTEKLLKQAKDAGLTAREHEVFKLFTENPGIKYREVADKLGYIGWCCWQGVGERRLARGLRSPIRGQARAFRRRDR
jgi:hypothetical protein